MLRNTHLYKVLYSQTFKFCFRSTFKNRIDCTIVSKNWNFCGSLCLELALTPYSFIFCCINAFLAIGAKLISFRSVSIVNTSKAADLLVPLFDSTSIVLRKFRNVHSWSAGKTWINKENMPYLKICIQILFVCKSLSSNNCLFAPKLQAVTSTREFELSSWYNNVGWPSSP